MPSVDARESSRRLAGLITALNPGAPVAVVNARREVEYGLNFYLDEPISNYTRGEMPAEVHIAILQEGTEAAFRSQFANRQVSNIGFDSRQRLQIFWVRP